MQGEPKYIPSEPVPPGETLRENLEFLGMTQTALATRMGRPKKTINEIIQGKAAITAETAVQLAAVFGTSSEFWLNLEANYQLAKAEAEARANLAIEMSLVGNYPYSEMVKWGMVRQTRKPAEKVVELHRFLGVASLKQVSYVWSVAYRRGRSKSPSPEALAVWLRKGELDAQMVETKPYDRSAFRAALEGLKSRMAEAGDGWVDDMVSTCAAAGVAVVFVPHLSRTYVNGATRWLTPQKALIQMSLRYKYKDIFWFTFFHEAAHILLHGKKDQFIDFETPTVSREEGEADKWARDYLVPQSDWDRLVHNTQISQSAIISFADEMGVPPEIVVGRLQHEGVIRHNQMNHLRPRVKWSNEQ